MNLPPDLYKKLEKLKVEVGAPSLQATAELIVERSIGSTSDMADRKALKKELQNFFEKREQKKKAGE